VVDLDTIVKLEKLVKELEREKDKALGRIEQKEKDLKDKFRCSGIEQAEELLKKKKQKLKKIEAKYESNFNSFMKKWKDKLNIEDI
jgi:deoxyribodipyrimidine photolyase